MTVGFYKQINNCSRRKFPTEDHFKQNTTSRVEDVYVDFGYPFVVSSNEISYENPLKDRVLRLLDRMRSDANVGMEAGSLVGMGSGIGAGIANVITFGQVNADIYGPIIGSSMCIGVVAGIGAGFSNGISGGVLAVSGIAGSVAGCVVVSGIETTAEVITGLYLPL